MTPTPDPGHRRSSDFATRPIGHALAPARCAERRARRSRLAKRPTLRVRARLRRLAQPRNHQHRCPGARQRRARRRAAREPVLHSHQQRPPADPDTADVARRLATPLAQPASSPPRSAGCMAMARGVGHAPAKSRREPRSRGSRFARQGGPSRRPVSSRSMIWGSEEVRAGHPLGLRLGAPWSEHRVLGWKIEHNPQPPAADRAIMAGTARPAAVPPVLVVDRWAAGVDRAGIARGACPSVVAGRPRTMPRSAVSFRSAGSSARRRIRRRRVRWSGCRTIGRPTSSPGGGSRTTSTSSLQVSWPRSHERCPQVQSDLAWDAWGDRRTTRVEVGGGPGSHGIGLQL